MIKLDISTALFIYLFFTVVLVLGLWTWLGRDSLSKTFRIERKDIWQCTVCGYVYVDAENEDFSRCPRCKSINKKNK